MTINNMPVQRLQLRDFQIRFTSGQTINEPIENIHQLDEIIRIYDRSIIAKISFYFHDSLRGFHNMILRNTEINNRFIVEFYQDYNSQMERIDLSREQQINDFTVVMNCLNSIQNLNSRLVPYIIDPFQQQYVT